MKRWKKISLCILLTGGLAAWYWWHHHLDWLNLPDDPVARLSVVPDLSPQLSAEEVTMAQAEWKSRLAEFLADNPDQQSFVGDTRGWQWLAPMLDDAKQITLYSLHPDPYFMNYPSEAHLAGLPQFYGYPIYGSVILDQPSEVTRWTGFLQSQIIGDGLHKCGFSPRHGFRFSTRWGDVDLLMCFECGDMAVPGAGRNRLLLRSLKWKPEFRSNPAFTFFVRDTLNRLFDKNGIKRSVPPPQS